MATPPEAVRRQLEVVTTTAAFDLQTLAAAAPLARRVDTLIAALPLIVPSYYDAAGSLALAWYDELRDESRPVTAYAPEVIGDPSTDWIERETTIFRESLDSGDLARDMDAMLTQASLLATKEVARGFRDSITGNTRQDRDAIGWSRVARSGACKLCTMIAARGAVFRESTAHFAAHTSCHCTARPEFRNGDHGPEASVEQYAASSKRRTPAQQKALRKYLNENYPDARG